MTKVNSSLNGLSRYMTGIGHCFWFQGEGGGIVRWQVSDLCLKCVTFIPIDDYHPLACFTIIIYWSSLSQLYVCHCEEGGGPRVVVSTAAFHARVRGSVPGLGGLKETKLFLPHPRVKVSIVGSLRDREVACSASDRQGSNFESCVWRTVSSQSSHHPQEVLLAQFSLYVHKGGLKPDSFHFIFCHCEKSRKI